MAEIIKKEDEAILLEIKKFNEMKKEVEAKDKALKKKILEYMEGNGVYEVDIQGIAKFSYIAPFKKKVVDTEALKEQGLYDSFTKDSEVGSSVRCKFY